jgi:hypothetical protein
MTCNVKGCTNPDITSFLCRIKMDETGNIEDHEVRVCTEHEKAFETLAEREERFVN